MSVNVSKCSTVRVAALACGLSAVFTGQRADAAINIATAGPIGTYVQNFNDFAALNAATPVSNTAPVAEPNFSFGGTIAVANGSGGGYGYDSNSGVASVSSSPSLTQGNGTYADGAGALQGDTNHGAVYAGTVYNGTPAGPTGDYAIIQRGQSSRHLTLNFSVTNTTGSVLTGLKLNYNIEQYTGASAAPATVSLFADSTGLVAGQSTSTDTLPAGYTQAALSGVATNAAGSHLTSNNAAFSGTNGLNVTADATTNGQSAFDLAGVPIALAAPLSASVAATYNLPIAPGATVNFLLQWAPSTGTGFPTYTFPTANGTTNITERAFIGVDDLSITGVSATPEPASLAVLALGGLGLVARRRATV